MKPENPNLLDTLELFVVTLPDNLEYFDLCPFGVSVAAYIDPLIMENTEFLGLLERMDEITFGPESMGMSRWLYLNGVELTGAIVGLGKNASAASEAARALLRVPDDYRGMVPYAVYMAIPMAEPGSFFGHNLASLAAWLPAESLHGLGSLTKALALKLYRATSQVGATQWDSRALFVHTRLGPLELLTAWTPAHGKPHTLTYRARITDASLRALAREPGARAPELLESSAVSWIASDDAPAMRRLQARIEVGERFAIVGRPERTGERQRVPVVPLPPLPPMKADAG